MCNCITQNCQYENFFNSEKLIIDKSLYYVKDNDSQDTYCLFHAPEELKEKFTYYKNELFKKIVLEYINFSKQNKQTIDFSQSIFHLPFEVNDLKEVTTIDFTNTTFLKYFRMDNLECNKVIFQDTEFHDGGGIKNRLKEKEVYIEKLVFRPYQLESDFVIDIGKYANNKGLIESNNYGVIKNIKFENHKKGKGIVYFIGFNEYLEKANFRNMILDNVSFQNCDLGKCCFLNAKVDKTEFRNCNFRSHMDEIDYNGFLYIKNWLYRHAIGMVIFVLFFLVSSFSIITFLIMIIIFAIFFPKFINSLLTLFIASFGILYVTKTKRVATYDEVLINKNLKGTLKNSKSFSLLSLEVLYRSLKENLGKNDFQTEGNFFYSQRTIQIMTTSNEYQRMLFLFHYIINGFGERFIRPIIWFFVTILVFSFNYTADKDFMGTNATPKFLINNYNTKMKNIEYSCSPYFYNLQIYKDKNNSIKLKKYTSLKFTAKVDDSITYNEKDVWKTFVNNFNIYKTVLVYSASQFISPFTSKNKSWFKTITPQAMIMNLMEMILLYLFFGAFILAIKNRIKR